MIYFPESIDQAISALQSMKSAGAVRVVSSLTLGGDVVDTIQVDLVWINRAGVIVGNEADDYRPQPGEIAVALIT